MVKNFVEQIELAKIKGSVFRLKVGFPVVVEDGDDLVEGQLLHLKSTTTELLLSLLDEFHGVNRMDSTKSLYFRKQIQVETEGGSSALAWIYDSIEKLQPSAQRVLGEIGKRPLNLNPC